MLLATAAGLAMGALLGVEPAAGADTLTEADDPAVRNRLRAMLFTGQAFTFLLPGLLVARWLHGRAWIRTLRLWPAPTPGQLLVGVLMMFCAVGLVAFTYQLNQAVPLPEWAASAESRADGMLETVLRMESVTELLVNLLLVGLLAGIGEELVFRGLLQPTLTRLFGGRAQAAVWGTAILFSAVHFQWGGFLPRLVLGVLLGYLFLLTGRLWVPIVAHVANNGFQVAGAFWLDESAAAAIEEAPAVTPLQAGCSLLLVLLGGFALQRISAPPVSPPSSQAPDE